MKETKKLYDSITNIDDRFIEEARAGEIRKAPVWRKWAGLAACLCIAAVSVAAIQPWKEGGTPVPNPDGTIEREPDHGEYPPAGIVSGVILDEPDEPDSGDRFPMLFNDVDASPAGEAAMVGLAPEDFQPMSVEKSLRYFGLTENVIIPGAGFELTGGGCFGGGHGVYRAEESGVYYDVNSYVFTKGGKSVTLTLRTVFKNLLPSPEQVKNGPEKIKLTEINGWDLALFRYEDGEDECVYTELVQEGVIFTVTARGLESDELASALESILPQKEGIPEPRTAAGTVTHVDSRTEDNFDGAQHHHNECHDYITVDCGGTLLTLWLPGEADRYSVGDRVTVTYNGEPATAYNIWPGQLVSVE